MIKKRRSRSPTSWWSSRPAELSRSAGPTTCTMSGKRVRDGGPITRLNGRLLRPHDIDVFETPHDATVPAEVERLQRVGFEVRADLRSGDSAFWVQLTPGQVEALNLREGAPVWVRPSRGAASIDPSQPDHGAVPISADRT